MTSKFAIFNRAAPFCFHQLTSKHENDTTPGQLLYFLAVTWTVLPTVIYIVGWSVPCWKCAVVLIIRFSCVDEQTLAEYQHAGKLLYTIEHTLFNYVEWHVGADSGALWRRMITVPTAYYSACLQVDNRSVGRPMFFLAPRFREANHERCWLVT